MGGRSRVASQMLSGNGFEKVLNMAGGIRAWNDPVAFGSQEQGLAQFNGHGAPAEVLQVAYSLEAGLRDFYLSMTQKVAEAPARDLFRKLSDIEIKHQDRIFDEYRRISGANVDRETFDSRSTGSVVEGGLTTEEYIDMFKPDLTSSGDIISLAMSIEAQALDLYTRAADKSNDERSREVLLDIAREERSHLAQLGKLIDSL